MIDDFSGRPAAVLFDRDGTLVVDVPYNGDPARVALMPGAVAGVARLHAAGIPTAVISNQSGIARGLLTAEQVDAVNARVAALLGPVGPFLVCPHGPTDGCGCRKPAPGLVLTAAQTLGVDPHDCVVIGDIGSDVDAALAAGARPILVPTGVTRAEEVAAAPEVAPDLLTAVDALLSGRTLPTGEVSGPSAARQEARRPQRLPKKGGTVLVVRPDNDGDVLLSGPAIRAVAAHADRVVLLCGPRGRQAAELLPDVDEVLVWHCPWIDSEPRRVDPADVLRMADEIRARAVDAAIVLTSYHQSPLPTALLLRLAGVPFVAATSDDYPGSLLDVRHRLPDSGLHEVERMLSLAQAAGFPLPMTDDAALRLRGPLPETAALTGDGAYVVVHPGASVPARAPSPGWSARAVDALVAAGYRVVVTGGPAERSLTAAVARDVAADLGGKTDLRGLAGVLARAEAVVVGNTGPAHLAAAVATPVVSLFAPTVPAERWRPWQVPHVLLGDQHAACAASRARTCPAPGHPCLDGIDPAEVVDAVRLLAGAPAPRPDRRIVEVGL